MQMTGTDPNRCGPRRLPAIVTSRSACRTRSGTPACGKSGERSPHLGADDLTEVVWLDLKKTTTSSAFRCSATETIG